MRALLLVFVVFLLFGGCARDELRGSFGCPDFQLVCDGVCTDVSTDAAHCGACDAACSGDDECRAGRCRAVCEAPLTPCAEGCVNTASDVDNCGACGNDCTPGARCVRGECTATGCPPGQQLCGDECIDTSTDANHCGECFSACPGSMRCDDNICVEGCAPLDNCDGTCVDFEVDREHCGDCATACGAGELCFNGRCRLSCPNGLARCNDRCVDLDEDPNNCGACGVYCGPDATCSGGTCVGCLPPAVQCGDVCVDPNNDPSHCGFCGFVCDQGLVCRQGECEDPASGCDFSNLAFPITLSGDISVGDVTIDTACNLYVGLESERNARGQIYSISAATGAVTLIANLAEPVRGLVYRREDRLLYGVNPDRLFRIETDGSGLEFFDDSQTDRYLNGMTLAPDNWAQRDGYLVVAQNTGDILSYDPEDPLPLSFVTTEANISDVEFDGPQLYVAAHSANQIQRVTPGGVISTFVDLPCSPDGLAVEPGVRLFAACGDTNEVYSIDLETRYVEWFASVRLSSGWAPSALLWDNGVLFVVEETTGLNAFFP